MKFIVAQSRFKLLYDTVIISVKLRSEDLYRQRILSVLYSLVILLLKTRFNSVYYPIYFVVILAV